MANLLPPTPVGVPPGHSFWNDWYEKLRSLINNAQIDVQWANIDFSGSNITSIATRNHNDLQNIAGGASNDYSHLTAVQNTNLTDGGDTTLHFHSSDRARANHTGTQLMSTISDLPTLASGSYTPVATNVANAVTINTFTSYWFRMGNKVFVFGQFNTTTTAAATKTRIRITLPVAATLGVASDVAGTVGLISNLNETSAGGIQGDTVNNEAILYFESVNTALRAYSFTLAYEI